MSAADRHEGPSPGDVATRLRDAGFVRFVVAPDGDSAAAVGLLASALDTSGVPYQISVTPLSERPERSTDADLTVAIGRSVPDAALTIGGDSTSSPRAYAVATELGSDRLELALAGAVAADGHPGDELATRAAERGIERRPSVGIPTTDRADGLVHSTLVHAPFSGDRTAVESAVAGLDFDEPEDRRALASQVALAVGTDPDGTACGASRAERFLRPLSGGPFETIEGYADVLDAVVREQPGLAVALAIGGVDRESALEVWRSHASEAHAAVRTARIGRYDELFVAQCDGQPPVGTVARLVAEFRSPESLVLVVGEGVAAARMVGEESPAVGTAIERTATEFGGLGGGTATAGRATFDADPTEFVAAFKETV
jgi:hypothetical protein